MVYKDKIPRLSVVATPIGNLDDMTQRAKDVLKEADVVLVEDSRRAAKLWKAYAIRPKKQCVYHMHNEQSMLPKVIQLWGQDMHVALISDAGTPLIHDPGHALLNAAYAHDVVVDAMPGPCALIQALVLSGLPSDDFHFLGFLPSQKQARLNRLEASSFQETTCIAYEAPHRIGASLRAIHETFNPQMPLVVCRELTKLYQTVVRISCGDIPAWLESHKPKGEYVLLWDARMHQVHEDLWDGLVDGLLVHYDKKEIMTMLQGLHPSKNRLYRRLHCNE